MCINVNIHMCTHTGILGAPWFIVVVFWVVLIILWIILVVFWVILVTLEQLSGLCGSAFALGCTLCDKH